MSLSIIEGDATRPQGDGRRIVAHVCNDLGAWGRGFVAAVSRQWPQAERAYRDWFRKRDVNDFGLGAVQLVYVGNDREPLWVANMVAQHGLLTGRAVRHQPPIRYAALEACLRILAAHASTLSASVHMPRIGCGLAGGKWEIVEPMIVGTLGVMDVPVTIYNYVPPAPSLPR